MDVRIAVRARARTNKHTCALISCAQVLRALHIGDSSSKKKQLIGLFEV